MNALDSLTVIPKDNLTAYVLWAVVGVIAFAFVSLFFGFKQVVQGKKVSKVNKGMLPFVKWPLLFASAGFNVFFTYYVFLPSGFAIATGTAGVMGGVNLAEAYLVRLVIATWRHDLKTIYKLALVFTVPVFLYSLMAAGSSFSTMMNKNQDTQIASQLKIEAAKDRILLAGAKVTQAEIKNQDAPVLQALNTAPVKNTLGVTVNFSAVNNSCLRQGYYAIHYPALCAQYKRALDGGNTLISVADAKTNALQESVNQKMQMAEIITDRPPSIVPVLLGFSLGIAAVGFIVSLALESAIIGVGFFEELFIKPTPLPALVKFANKDLDWVPQDTDKTLRVDVSPSPGTVDIVDSSDDDKSNPFSVSLPSAVADGKPSADTDTKPSADTEKEYYLRWLGLVKAGQERPTVKPTTRWISKNNIDELLVSNGIVKIEEKAYQWLASAVQDGVIKDNPTSGVGKPMYVLVEG